MSSTPACSGGGRAAAGGSANGGGKGGRAGRAGRAPLTYSHWGCRSRGQQQRNSSFGGRSLRATGWGLQGQLVQEKSGDSALVTSGASVVECTAPIRGVEDVAHSSEDPAAHADHGSEQHINLGPEQELILQVALEFEEGTDVQRLQEPGHNRWDCHEPKVEECHRAKHVRGEVDFTGVRGQDHFPPWSEERF